MPAQPQPQPPSSQSPTPPPTFRRRASASPARDGGGVKHITRKVIRTLEGLGHLDPPSEQGEGEEGDEEEYEVARTLSLERKGKGKQRELKESKEKKKIDWEVPRKVFHSSIGFITLGLYLTPSMAPRSVALVLWAAFAVLAPTDFVRLRVPAVERVYERAVGFLMRESERHGTNGTLWYILGVNFALTFYPIDVATVAILMCVYCSLFFLFPFPPEPTSLYSAPFIPFVSRLPSPFLSTPRYAGPRVPRPPFSAFRVPFFTSAPPIYAPPAAAALWYTRDLLKLFRARSCRMSLGRVPLSTDLLARSGAIVGTIVGGSCTSPRILAASLCHSLRLWVGELLIAFFSFFVL
ncbi:hypothetical protein B0H17DRAFT_1206820 [Mycena rosella]|uniref:Phosphatidate cytidylyltransferase n=1 Tax=Mycena rosella TaxID=1033263 RepID=A0AAD7GD31_MYCRO|nr:hypothetical protein B0H17DRAFT_1206820 [Mycena rosella]